jgi:uncharacterized protein (TIGR00251 family)
LKVRVSPGASREAILGLYGDALKVSVREPPERGRANRAVVRILAAALNVRSSRVAVLSGSSSRDKWVLLEDLEPEIARERIRGILVTLDPE